MKWVVLLPCFCGLLSSAPLVAKDRPNVLLILVDDLKPSFGAYGEPWVHSPNLDRLAARGIRFDLAYCNQAVCAPSRNNLMTGARSTSLGVYSLGYHFRKAVPGAVTMPQHFKQHGYHSAGIGKVFHIGHGNVDDKLSWSVVTVLASARLPGETYGTQVMIPIPTLVLLLTPLLGAPPVSPERFEELHALIRPQAGEFTWYEEIPWHTSIQDALEKAAAEGKPILVWTSADGQPCGAT